MDVIRQDLKHAVRMLTRRPGWATAAVATLALGIGATTAIYSFVHGVLLAPLPYPDADRIVSVRQVEAESGEGLEVFTYPWYEAWREEQDVLDQFGAYAPQGFTLNLEDRSERLRGAWVTSQVLDLLGADPILGRGLRPEDDVPGTEPVVLISEGEWRSRYGADPGILGTVVTLNEEPRAVVGVLPSSFGFPEEETAYWESFGAAYRGAGTAYLSALARLPDGRTLAATRAGLGRATRTTETDDGTVELALAIDPFHTTVVGDASGGLLMFLGAVAVLLLVATLNVANLLLLRAAERSRELGVRAALGAGRGRLVRLHVTEGLVLAAVAGVLGTFLAVWLVDGMRLLVSDLLPRAHEITVNLPVLLFSVAVTLGTGVAVGFAPAVRSGLGDVAQRLRSSDTNVAGRPGARLRAGLVVGQLALATVLLVGGGLLTRSFVELVKVDAGVDVDRVTGLQVTTGSRYGSVEARQAFYTQLMGRLEAAPEIERAAVVSFLPFSQGRSIYDLAVQGRSADDGAGGSLELLVVSPSYFETTGNALREGRYLADSDGAGSLPVAVINETAAQRHWPGGSAVGAQIQLEDDTWRTVVGVVADTRQHGLDAPPSENVYLPYAQAGDKWPFGMWVMIRAGETVDRGAVGRAAGAAVAAVDRYVAIASLRPLAASRSGSVAEPRLRALLVGLFSASALLLAVIGVYGVIAHMVTQRTREVGVRIALGATRLQIVRTLVARGAALTVLGLGIGLALALALGRVIESYLFGITPGDPATLALIAAILAGAALLASYLPARRAARLEPVQALTPE